ncbi:amino acid ABC transporter ATP-binding protein, PAAT family [Arthrobacter sp. cf158]|uniref:amino acid ABC transporter ATP-binding protein n=1 Tax=Arthrobacter sp. cf158 TaxID=1761744 RepID=UPI00089B2808|nr:amino acid ABC transporter ATP-binding protein [Arthrobacter sp. cf158]SDW91665.1 amino acid ABC transporter ATP-binding protein, PAAT family [Arthrobacter sp. cf158]
MIPSTIEPLLSVSDLAKSYGANEILKGVNFSIKAGEVKAILGASGSGKSTMLRLIALLERADRGEIVLAGRRLGVADRAGKDTAASERQLAHQRRDVGMVFQQFNLFPHMDALHNVALALTIVQKVRKHEALEAAAEMLNRVGLGNRSHKYPRELSGGQQQRVAIARALVLNPSVLLFDEPTSALDVELVGEVLKVMESLAADGMTMIVVTHEIGFAKRVADEVLMFDRGSIIEQADPETFFGSPAHERTRSFLSHVR